MTAEGQVVLPSQFGRYTLIERLAVGGMAEVFRAKIVSSHGFEKIIVIKRILPHLAADRTFVTMFIDEAKVMAQLTHPKIVQVLDFGEVGGQYFIALEFIDGIDGLALLRAAAKKGIRVPIPLVVFVVTEILDALDYAHTALNMEGRPDAPRAPGHLAVQHLHRAPRRREAGRFRHCARRRPRIEDPGGNAQRKIRIHVARTGGRGRAGRSFGLVCRRDRARRGLHGAASFCGTKRVGCAAHGS